MEPDGIGKITSLKGRRKGWGEGGARKSKSDGHGMCLECQSVSV